MIDKVEASDKNDIYINTKVYVQDENHVKFHVETNIPEYDPEVMGDVDIDDPNMLLFFWWAQAMATTAGLASDAARGKLASDLFDIIVDTQSKAVCNACVEEINGLSPIQDKSDDGKIHAVVGTHDINATINRQSDTESANITVETDIQDLEPGEAKNKVLYYYWTRALADSSLALRSHLEKEMLANKLYQALMDADESLAVSINDGAGK